MALYCRLVAHDTPPAGTPEDRDSFIAGLEQAAKSDRGKLFAAAFLRWVGPLLIGSVVLPAWGWATTRYDRKEAELLVARVAELERSAGLPQPGAGGGPTLRERIGQLEALGKEREQLDLQKVHAAYASVVELAIGLKPAAPRAVRDALEAYELVAQCRGKPGDPLAPFTCAVPPRQAALRALGR